MVSSELVRQKKDRDCEVTIGRWVVSALCIFQEYKLNACTTVK